MSMRIVGGKYRHRLIEYPNDASHIRPTKDRIREAIFNALGDISGLTVLDLYAGSGAMGIEALSRGAEKCYFVDKNYIAINTIKNNLSSLLIKDCFHNRIDIFWVLGDVSEYRLLDRGLMIC